MAGAIACATGRGVLFGCLPPQPLNSTMPALSPTAKMFVSDANPGLFRKTIPSL
jgi:hypothetical protein